MGQVDLIIVGGFLAAGKTTLLARAAERLAARGKRVGLVTNDQAANLVDTAILEHAGAGVQEVAGGCFCCRFADLITAAQDLVRRFRPDVVICEPVGSCTDLSATVIQPIKRMHGEQFRVAPFSVLVEPSRAMVSLPDHAKSPFPDTVSYIYRKQLEEADLIVLNKADELGPSDLAQLEDLVRGLFPGTPLVAMSALRGDGVDAWLDLVGGDTPSGRRIAEVDYDRYAAGEAALGWLNAKVELRAERPADWRAFCESFLGALQEEVCVVSGEIAHVKLRLAADGRQAAANVAGNHDPPSIRGDDDLRSTEATLLVNARVHVSPDALRGGLERALRATAGEGVRASIVQIQHFAPARPQPTHRFNSVGE
jgi:G3E family GTPase